MAENKQKFSVAIKSNTIQALIYNTLGDKEIARNFVANISGVVSNNPALQNCDTGSIIASGLLAESLKLSMAPALGYCYLVPYGNKAQFIVSYRGLVQLAIRSGLYSDINVQAVHDGQYKGRNENGKDLFDFDPKYDNNEIIGYYAYFVLENGFTKSLYWTVEQCKQHGKKYSRAYGTGKTTDLWTNEFDLMAKKTVLKKLLKDWGILSVEMQTAVQRDQTANDTDGNYEYVDNTSYTDEEVKTNINIPDIPEDAKESL